MNFFLSFLFCCVLGTWIKDCRVSNEDTILNRSHFMDMIYQSNVTFDPYR